MLPQSVNNPQVVFPAQPGLNRAVRQHAEVGQHRVNGRRRRRRPEPAAGDYPFPHHLRRKAGENRRRHIPPGLLRRPAGPGRRLNRPPVHKRQPGRDVGPGGGQLQRHIGAPGMPHNNRTPPAHRADKRRRIAGHRGEVVAVVHLSRPAMPPLVQRRNAEIRGQHRRRQVPNVASGSQPVQQQNGPAGAAPVAVVEGKAAQVNITVLRNSHKFAIPQWRWSGCGAQ